MKNNDIIISIVWLFIFLLPPLIVYFIKKQTTNKTIKIYLLIFTVAVIISSLLYSIYENLYVTLFVLFGFGIIALVILIHMNNKEKKQRNVE